MPIGEDPTKVKYFIPFATHFQSGGKSGNGVWLTAVFATPNVDTSFAIANGMVPDGYFVFQASVPGVVYNGSNQGTDWSSNLIVLRASAAGTYRLWIS